MDNRGYEMASKRLQGGYAVTSRAVTAWIAGLLFCASGFGQVPAAKQTEVSQTAPTAMAPTAPIPKEAHEHVAANPSTTLVVTVDNKPVTLTLADLQKMPQKIVSVHNAHSKADETYSGVPLTDLLGRYGISADGAGARRVYHSYVRAEGTDHYWVIYSASELEDAIHNAAVIVALTLDGKPIGEDGQFKLVAGAEKKPARWVRNLSALTFVTVE